MEEAIKKINEEMQKVPNDPYTEIIGHYLIDRAIDPAAASCLIKREKSLSKAMEKIVEAARKKKRGNVAVLLPGEVFGIVDGYFGLTEDTASRYRAMASVGAPRPGDVPVQNNLKVVNGGRSPRRIDINLDDYL